MIAGRDYLIGTFDMNIRNPRRALMSGASRRVELEQLTKRQRALIEYDTQRMVEQEKRQEQLQGAATKQT